jgi:formylmethanofuran dehydrogenase subunit D
VKVTDPGTKICLKDYKMAEIKTYTAKVAEENGNLVLVFLPEMLTELGWSEGDNIVWDVRDDAIVVKKAD